MCKWNAIDDGNRTKRRTSYYRVSDVVRYLPALLDKLSIIQATLLSRRSIAWTAVVVNTKLTLKSLELEEFPAKWDQLADVGDLLAEVGPRLRSLAIRPPCHLPLDRHFGLPFQIPGAAAPWHPGMAGLNPGELPCGRRCTVYGPMTD